MSTDPDYADVEYCDHCGRLMLCQWAPDPLEPKEGFPESSWWCGRCYDERRDEETYEPRSER